MTTTTENLGLKSPEITDDPRMTYIDNVQYNNNKLDQVIIIDYESIPYKHYPRDKKVFFKNRNIGDYVGAINVRTGEYTRTWSPLTLVNIGDKISPTINNGHFYTCNKTGYTSPLEPDWLLANDSITEDTKNKSVWQANKHYEVNEIVVPSIDNDLFYRCETSGTSGTTEPIWSTEGVAISDNQVVWIGYRIVRWQESGVSAHFRPFGKID
jgi:hypothetical protein